MKKINFALGKASGTAIGEVDANSTSSSGAGGLSSFAGLVLSTRGPVIQAASESKGGDSGGITRKYTDCKIYCDAIDMASDDVTTIVRPSLRIVYNWFE